jgi:hypothetical protein
MQGCMLDRQRIREVLMSERRSFSDKVKKQVQQRANSLAEGANEFSRGVKESFGGGNVAECWTEQQVRFSEDARMAARRALWFLRLVELDSEPPLCQHAQTKAYEQLHTVRVPEPPEWCQPGQDKKTREANCPYTGALEPSFATLVEMWKGILATLRGPGTLTVAQLRKVEEDVERFIRRSRPLDWAIRFTYSMAPALRAFTMQHLGLILTFFVGLAVCAGVEAVRSILMNRPIFLLLALFVAFLPLGILAMLQLAFALRGRSAWWNLGGRVVHSLPVSVEPERWIEWHPRGYARDIFASLGIKLLLHVGLWVVTFVALRALVQANGWDGVSLTVYLIVMGWALLVLLGGVVDFADMHSRSPVRAMMVGGAVVTGIVVVLTDSSPAAPVALGIWIALMVWWSKRVRNMDIVYVPSLIVILTVTIWGFTESRQKDDVWRPHPSATQPLQSSEWPMGDSTGAPIVVLAASGGGSRAAIFTAKTLAALEATQPAVARNLQAISSVSGGSLANAAYVSRQLRKAGVVTDTTGTHCDEAIDSAVARDFIQPTILGIVKRGGRGKAIQNEWERCPVGLANVSIDMLAETWRAAKQRNAKTAPFPIPLFNSTTLERNAVVISPLDQAFFASPFDSVARDPKLNAYGQIESPTWVFYRSGIYNLSDISGGMNAPLSAAVRASANFPFGFPLVEVELEKQRRLWYSTTMARKGDTTQADTSAQLVRLTDGGALSNSGMWPLVPLLVNQRERVGNNRGVLMIVVDASRMPGAPWTDRQRGLMATLLDKNPKGERLHLQMIEQLEAQYGDCFGYVYIGIEPQPKYNVYTTWALDRGSQRLVHNAFANAWADAGPQIAREYARLDTCENGKDARKRSKLRPTRVPLS